MAPKILLIDDEESICSLVRLHFQTEGYVVYTALDTEEAVRALSHNPDLILLDEPAAGLNPSERKLFIEYLQKVYEGGIDLFLIEHNMDVVMSISHRITVINFGTRIIEGSPQEVVNNPEVIKAYLGDKFKA